MMFTEDDDQVHRPLTQDPDEAVQLTADDALVSKHSAANLGYVSDPFLGAFVRKPARRSPLINRGYYARVAAIQCIIQQFIDTAHVDGGGRVQVVSLGAGFDTTFFRLKNEGKFNRVQLNYVEVDFMDLCLQKSNLLKKHKSFKDVLPQETLRKSPSFEIHTEDYHLVAADLRDLKQLEKALVSAGVDFSQPILYISECVIVYMPVIESAELIHWTAEQSKKGGGASMFATYEQIRPFDAFGKIMIENLRRRGCELRGLEAHPTIQAEEDRFKRLGWSNSHALDLNDIYNHVIPKEEIQRIEKLELFDEFEEWHLISAHYCICVSTLNSSTLNLDQIAFMSIPNTSSRTS